MEYAIAQLRHLYKNLIEGGVKDSASAKRIAEGLLSPAIKELERLRSGGVPGHTCFNGWFLAQPEGRQAVLRDDKWKLSDAAFEADCAQSAQAAEALPTPKAEPPHCKLCGSDEAFTGTCGGGRDNPHALCFQSSVTTTKAETEPAIHRDCWPVDSNASRKQLIGQIGSMSFQLSALRQENVGLIKRVTGQAEALRSYERATEAQPAVEPVAWLYTDRLGGVQAFTTEPPPGLKEKCQPLFTSPAPAPNALDAEIVKDAERYRWLAAKCRSTSEHWGGRWSIVVDGPAPATSNSEDDFDAAIDAAIAALDKAESP